MALYHISLMKGKKSNGDHVQAVEHVKYINREEKYADADKEPENMIKVPTREKPLLDGKSVYLYKSGFGNILSTAEGLRLSGMASSVTIGIAMQIANKIYGEKVELAGSHKFKEQAIRVAAEYNLSVHFTDEKTEKAVQEKKEELESERELFRQKGGKILYPRKLSEYNSSGIGAGEKSISQLTTFDISSLRELSERCLDGSGQRDASVLLHDSARGKLEELRAESTPPVRWNLSRSRRRAIEQTTTAILDNVENFKESISAAAHVQYINREAAFQKKGGCIYTSNRLPKWAQGDPKRFFRAADRYEAKDANRYLELQMALPNELSLEQNLELIHKFIEREIPDQYYTFAIHDKIGALSDSTRHLHVHLMFSERSIDDAEKEKERSARKFFSYPKRNAKTLEEKRKGGAPRNRRFNHQGFVREVREAYAEITNEILEKYGCPDRVDHRSLKEMRKEALANGDEYLAKILDRTPERSLGPVGVLNTDSAEVKLLREERKERNKYHNQLFQVVFSKNEIADFDLREEAQKASDAAVALMESKEYHEHLDSTKGSDPYLDDLKKNFDEAMASMRKASRITSWSNDILEEAEVAFLPQNERSAWMAYQQKVRELENWKAFSSSIDTTDLSEKNRPYLTLLTPVDKKIKALEKELEAMQEHHDELEKSLLDPVIRDRLQKYINRRWLEEKSHREEYRHAATHLFHMVEQYQRALQEDDVREKTQDTYPIRELYAVMRRRYYGWKKELERARKHESALQKKVITPQRAATMAESIWSRGALKKLRAESRKLKTQRKKLEAKKAAGGNMQQLQAWETELTEKEKAVASELQTWTERLNTPAARLKVREIAAGILRKNQSITSRYEATKRYAAYAEERFQKAKKEMLVVKECVKKDPSSARYKVVHSTGSWSSHHHNTNSSSKMPDYPSIIAEALQNQPKAVQVVARSTDDGLKKDWTMMTDFERDEELEKQMMRDL